MSERMIISRKTSFTCSAHLPPYSPKRHNKFPPLRAIVHSLLDCTSPVNLGTVISASFSNMKTKVVLHLFLHLFLISGNCVIRGKNRSRWNACAYNFASIHGYDFWTQKSSVFSNSSLNNVNFAFQDRNEDEKAPSTVQATIKALK